MNIDLEKPGRGRDEYRSRKARERERDLGREEDFTNDYNELLGALEITVNLY